ncbi:hypothetical protein [Mycobacteroides abscessus]|uniref:hypothetical protein n=1 Tax=Mycobacteroides abscessus TaxID=36809 RepID=UPI001F48B0C5|nr:hypothetical protein [Mycobacteroides abscessus]
MSVLRIAWRLDGSDLMQSMLATMAGRDAPHHCRGSAGEAQGLMDQDASLVRGVCAERAAVAIPHLAGLGPRRTHV